MKTNHYQCLGFSLIEVAVALGVAGVCLSSLVGLMPLGMGSNQATIEQMAAASIARAVATDLRFSANGKLGPVSSTFQFNIPQAGDAASGDMPQTVYFDESGAPTGNGVGAAPVKTGPVVSRYRVSVGFTPPSSDQKTSTVVRILVTWPVAGEKTPSQWPTKFSGSYEALVCLVQG